MTKISKQQAEYKDEANGLKVCGFCSMWRANLSCTLVEGKISPRGRCKFWENMLTGKGKPSE